MRWLYIEGTDSFVSVSGVRRERGHAPARTGIFSSGTCCATSLVALGLALTCEKQKEGDPMFCPKCGTKNVDEAKFCVACGNPLPAVAAETAPPQEKPVIRL